MHISSAMLANQAAIIGGLLTVQGGGWEYYQAPAIPATVSGYVAGIAEFSEASEGVVLRVEVVDSDGNAQQTGSAVAVASEPDALGFVRVPFCIPFMVALTSWGIWSLRISDDNGALTAISFELRPSV